MLKLLFSFCLIPLWSSGQFELPNAPINKTGVFKTLDTLLSRDPNLVFSSQVYNLHYFSATYPETSKYLCVQIGGSWIVYNIDIESIDSVYTQDLNGGLPELIIRCNSLDGMSSQYAGWAMNETRLMIIDFDQDQVLLDIPTQSSLDNWDEEGTYLNTKCKVDVSLNTGNSRSLK